MSAPVDAEMMAKAINQDFMNKMQLAANMMAEYNPDTLSLFSKADYSQRKQIIGLLFGVMQSATQRQIKISFDLKDCEYYIKYFRKIMNKNEVMIWESLKVGSLRLQSRNDAILLQVKAGLALFRGTGVFDAFEAYEEAVSDVLGLENKGLKQVHGAKDNAEKMVEEKKDVKPKSILKKMEDVIKGE